MTNKQQYVERKKYKKEQIYDAIAKRIREICDLTDSVTSAECLKNTLLRMGYEIICTNDISRYNDRYELIPKFDKTYQIVDQYDTWMSYNEIKQYYTDNYTFIYKQKTLSKSLTKQFLQQLKGQSHIHGSKDKDMVLHQFNDSESDDFGQIIIQIDKKTKTIYAFRVKSGSKEYIGTQIAYQRGYKIFHNDKELSSKKDVNKVLDKMEDADNYMIEANDKNKTLNIIDP